MRKKIKANLVMVFPRIVSASDLVEFAHEDAEAKSTMPTKSGHWLDITQLKRKSAFASISVEHVLWNRHDENATDEQTSSERIGPVVDVNGQVFGHMVIIEPVKPDKLPTRTGP